MSSIYKHWETAMPSMAFPYQHTNLKEGVSVKKTWSDVREAQNLEGRSTTLHRCTAHFTPTALQSAILRDEIARDTRFSASPPSTARERSAPRPDILFTDSPQRSLGNSDSSTFSMPSIRGVSQRGTSPSRTPRDLVAKGRVEYLREKRMKPVNVSGVSEESSVGFAPASKSYGSVCVTGKSSTTLSLGDRSKFHRRAHGMKDSYRMNGVFN
jgi:hypothetical protein